MPKAKSKAKTKKTAKKPKTKAKSGLSWLGLGKKKPKAAKVPKAAKKPKTAKIPKVAKKSKAAKVSKVAKKPKVAKKLKPKPIAKAKPPKEPKKKAPAKAKKSAKEVAAAAPTKECAFGSCEEVAITGDYCRYHYIANWRRLKAKERVLAEKRLNKYIEELTSRYPEEYLEVIRKDLSSDKSFHELLQDLDIEELSTSSDDFDETELKKLKIEEDF
ncbi:hypothetical protein ACFLRA_01840 [Bdellovibrionota bacterium]